jgi:hypothetical protein
MTWSLKRKTENENDFFARNESSEHQKVHYTLYAGDFPLADYARTVM